MSTVASQITSISIVYSTDCSDADQSSMLLAFVRGIHQWPVNSPHKGPVAWKMFPFDDVIMEAWTNVSYLQLVVDLLVLMDSVDGPPPNKELP